jgi:LPXTG-motif cell wall-anchored protein
MNGLGVINWTAVGQATTVVSNAATTAANIYTQVKPAGGSSSNLSPGASAVQNAINTQNPTTKSNTTTYLIIAGVSAAAIGTGIFLYRKKKKKAA